MTELPPGGQESAASPEEVSSAIRALTAAQLNRLRDYAKWRARALSAGGCPADDEDLLQEAVKRTVSGERRWNKGVGFDVHLIGVMRSISSHLRRRGAGLERSPNPGRPDRGGADESEGVASNEPNPERIAAAKRFIDHLLDAFRHDSDVQLAINGLREDWTPEEYSQRGLTKERREAAVKRMRRDLRSAFPNGRTDVY